MEETPSPLNSLVFNAMAITKRLAACAAAVKKRQRCVLALALLMMGTLARAADLIVPIADAEADRGGRGYNWVSIHPDSQRWLITECTAQRGQLSCLPYLYDFRSGSYQRFALPDGYLYLHARFSPSGNVIVAERNPVSVDGTTEEKLRLLRQTEFIRVNTDGTGFQVLPIPKGESTYAVMSPDESKIAYWSAAEAAAGEGQPKKRIHEIREFDLVTQADRLFAGPFDFRLVGNLEYRDNDSIAAQAYGSSAREPVTVPGEKHHLMEIVRLHRDAKKLPEPLVAEHFMYSSAIFDNRQRLHLMTKEKSGELSMAKIDAQGERYVWHSPRIANSAMLAMAVPPDGRYTAFIYMTEPVLSTPQKNRLGYFCNCNGGWYSVRLPSADTAETIAVR